MEIEKVVFPFKNQNWHQRKKQLKVSKNQRQNKNLKQICASELTSRNKFNYMSIEGPPPLKPQKKYCDITGFESKYKDKSSGLQYHDKYVYEYINTSVSRPMVEQFLSLRKINVNN
ncbi:chromatin-remodeling complex protein, putative (macronuclear) [Tetrahymena thermophila SB210]|uniref:Chromatin-remodeling complex protein, putative n=1 Tax=Tetrahymena thermophila (strain SB210) TaxID=312017 RepID=I7MN28_TETTS|nr:chromatin-remodeling complex protein, putative [Tetrahymena thermophila SB210]EAS07791.3 chromatin-remodeling complex protein, putative [Tetrahymena thermophila SB210]|eukprot:XP_001028033.3 chromatin-remodeling complex protein, putative [Tetrahymena thermophila SB210]